MSNSIAIRSFQPNAGVASSFIKFLLESPYALGLIGSSIALFITYLLAADFSYYFVIPPSKNAAFWIPSGISFALAIWTRNSPKLWPGWAIALVLAQISIDTKNNVPLITTLLWSASNISLGAVTILLARSQIEDNFDLGRIRQVVMFFLMVPIVVIPGALIAATGSSLGFGDIDFANFALSWATSDALGIYLVAPAILTWNSNSRSVPGTRAEGIFLLLLLILASGTISFFYTEVRLDWAYFAFLTIFVAWASIRFGPRGTACSLLFINFVEVASVVHGIGTGAMGTIDGQEFLITLQFLIATVGLLMMLLAAAIEEQRTARLAAEEALRTRDEFISVASHELNSPLSALSMQVQVLNQIINEDNIHKFSKEQLKELTQISENQVHKFATLVRNLLDVSRIRASRLHLNLEEVNLSQLIRDAAKRFILDLQRAKCELTVSCEGEIFGIWDRMRIEQVLGNLVTNAMKYGAGHPIYLTAKVLGGRVQLTVTDHGIGIDPKDHKRIFERFERAVDSKFFTGLGLGLYIVRQILEEHQGSISIESSPGQGATFIVDLPVRSYPNK